MLIAARPSPLPRHLWLVLPGVLLLAGTLSTAPCTTGDETTRRRPSRASAPSPAPGEWLMATEAMPDSTFRGSEILMLGHDEQGAVGLVMNGERRVVERGMTVANCGPVGLGVVVAVHRPSLRLPSTRPINDRWAISAAEDVLEAIDRHDALDDLVLCVGYAGWGPSQLDGELAEGVWRVQRSAPSHY